MTVLKGRYFVNRSQINLRFPIIGINSRLLINNDNVKLNANYQKSQQIATET